MTDNRSSEERPVVGVVRSAYQPSKAELEADMRIDATPEQAARAVMRRVKVRTIRRPKAGD